MPLSVHNAATRGLDNMARVLFAPARTCARIISVSFYFTARHCSHASVVRCLCVCMCVCAYKLALMRDCRIFRVLDFRVCVCVRVLSLWCIIYIGIERGSDKFPCPLFSWFSVGVAVRWLYAIARRFLFGFYYVIKGFAFKVKKRRLLSMTNYCGCFTAFFFFFLTTKEVSALFYQPCYIVRTEWRSLLVYSVLFFLLFL